MIIKLTNHSILILQNTYKFPNLKRTKITIQRH